MHNIKRAFGCTLKRPADYDVFGNTPPVDPNSGCSGSYSRVERRIACASDGIASLKQQLTGICQLVIDSVDNCVDVRALVRAVKYVTTAHSCLTGRKTSLRSSSDAEGKVGRHVAIHGMAAKRKVGSHQTKSKKLKVKVRQASESDHLQDDVGNRLSFLSTFLELGDAC